MKPSQSKIDLDITVTDDWHLHLRDGAEMASVVGFTAQRFARAIVMPNLRPPITKTVSAAAYRDRILSALPHGRELTPLMTLYLTDTLSPAEIAVAKDSGTVYAAKLYPAGATTNSENGVTSINRIYRVLDVMQRMDMPLLVHGEATDPEVALLPPFLALSLASTIQLQLPSLKPWRLTLQTSPEPWLAENV